jgi:hypothetical protein
MKRNLKKLSLKKQTLHLLNGHEKNVQQGGAATYRCSIDKACATDSLQPCSGNCPSYDTRCNTCWG